VFPPVIHKPLGPLVSLPLLHGVAASDRFGENWLADWIRAD
jgi:hypothetical protein